MILGNDGEKMSKSRGNVVNPDEARDKYGADALRCFILFLGPMDRDKPWIESGIDGVQRFLERFWRAVADEGGRPAFDDSPLPEPLERALHKAIKKVGDDIEALSFNTAISAMMILVNEAYRAGSKSRRWLRPLAQLLAPFAPHLAEEAWRLLGESGLVALAPWPSFDSNLTVDAVVTIGVQVNGKSRGAIEVAIDAPEAVALAAAREVPTVQNALKGQEPDKVIYKAGRILNLIVKA
jgi:leucyl-tRNA synthetase